MFYTEDGITGLEEYAQTNGRPVVDLDVLVRLIDDENNAYGEAYLRHLHHRHEALVAQDLADRHARARDEAMREAREEVKRRGLDWRKWKRQNLRAL